MRLKRTSFTTNKKGLEKEKKGEALISRQAPGMCFAFHPKVSYFTSLVIILYDYFHGRKQNIKKNYVLQKNKPPTTSLVIVANPR